MRRSSGVEGCNTAQSASARWGRELIGLHLLEDPRLAATTARLVDEGERPVGRHPRYTEPDRTLHLGEPGLALVGIAPEVWEYRVGGYRVLGQWLRARERRVLGEEERRALPRIADALRLTLELQARIAEAAGQ